MARLAKQPIPMKVYRHFAVITLAATALLAILSDSESHEAVSTAIEEHREESALRRESEARFADAHDAVAPVAASFSDDAPAGQPALALRPSTGAAIPADPRLATDPITAQAEAIGYPPEVLARMTPAEREQLVEGLQDAGMLSPTERKGRTAALLAASSTRSGASAAAAAADLR